MADSRRVLEERRAQAVGSLREVERRQAAGEIGDDEAAELIALFADRAALASAELEAAGGAPPSSRRPRERLLPVAAVAAVLVLTVLVVVVSQLSSDDRDGGDAAAPPQRDLSEVTTQEMEEVIADNPDVVPMRLALVERYLDAGDIARANEHAAEAAARATGADDRHRAEVFLGWTTALLGDPAEGARLLRAATEARPDDLNARWFLARALVDAGEAEEARVLLEQLLEEDIGDAQREAVEETLASL